MHTVFNTKVDLGRHRQTAFKGSPISFFHPTISYFKTLFYASPQSLDTIALIKMAHIALKLAYLAVTMPSSKLGSGSLQDPPLKPRLW
jgi:hypothetical protein